MAEKLERSYTIPLRKSYVESPRYKRTPKAVKAVRDFLTKHMKGDEVRLGQHLNTFLWKHGIKNPPARVKVHAVREDGIVRAELEGKTFLESVKPTPKEEGGDSLKDRLTEKLAKPKGKEADGEATPAKPEAKEKTAPGAKPAAATPKKKAEPKTEQKPAAKKS